MFASCFMLMATCTTLVSCGKDEEETTEFADKQNNGDSNAQDGEETVSPIVGVWLLEQATMSQYTVLAKDGKMEIYSIDFDNEQYSRSKDATYTYSDGILTMSGERSIKAKDMVISQSLDSKMNITLGDGIISYTVNDFDYVMKRVSESDPDYIYAKKLSINQLGF